MIKSITLTDFLSYGPTTSPIELRALNVIIGPNGSGKSNLSSPSNCFALQDVLVDALTDMPEAVLVAGRSEAGTTLERLDQEKLEPWLKKYQLGQLWTRGEIRGTRW